MKTLFMQTASFSILKFLLFSDHYTCSYRSACQVLFGNWM